jgi:hypothetical protein
LVGEILERVALPRRKGQQQPHQTEISLVASDRALS